MGPNSGYSWTSTSQWGGLPSGPQQDNNSQNAPQTNNTAPSSPIPLTQQPTAPQESRRDLVTRLYKAILGREPDNAGLNYYLFNVNILELQIAKDMYESTEHQDILIKSKDIREMIQKTSDTEQKYNELVNNFNKTQALAENYKSLISQKTTIINDLLSKQSDDQGNTPQISENSQFINPQYVQPAQSEADKGNDIKQFEQQLMLEDPFADDNKGKGKGIFNWIKNWFKFN